MPDGRSFEERVLARLDSIDGRLGSLDGRLESVEGRLESVDGRLGSLENKVERRALETKPIWERVLAEILKVKEHVSSLEQTSNQMVRKIDVLAKDMLTMRADQTGLEYRIDKLESKPV